MSFHNAVLLQSFGVVELLDYPLVSVVRLGESESAIYSHLALTTAHQWDANDTKMLWYGEWHHANMLWCLFKLVPMVYNTNVTVGLLRLNPKQLLACMYRLLKHKRTCSWYMQLKNNLYGSCNQAMSMR
jgi:hypothetical protein